MGLRFLIKQELNLMVSSLQWIGESRGAICTGMSTCLINATRHTNTSHSKSQELRGKQWCWSKQPEALMGGIKTPGTKKETFYKALRVKQRLTMIDKN